MIFPAMNGGWLDILRKILAELKKPKGGASAGSESGSVQDAGSSGS